MRGDDLFESLFPERFEKDKRINTAQFYSALINYAAGITSHEMIVKTYNLQGEAARQLRRILKAIDALSNDGEKALFCAKINSLTDQVEQGTLTRRDYLRSLGLGT